MEICLLKTKKHHFLNLDLNQFKSMLCRNSNFSQLSIENIYDYDCILHTSNFTLLFNNKKLKFLN